MIDPVSDAYDRRAAEYAERLGAMDAMHPSDRALVDTWSAEVTGPVLDAGCGPGHWSGHLHRRGLDATGIDRSARMIEIARATHPDVPFAIADLAQCPGGPDSWDAILAWYSLIHLEPDEVPAALAGFARVLRSDGELLLGFFEGPRAEAFDHAVVPARTWPVETMIDLLDQAGFTVRETHRRTSPDHRPHAAITAVRRP